MTGEKPGILFVDEAIQEKPGILFVDEAIQCFVEKIRLLGKYECQVDIAESIELAKEYLDRANYLVVIMEPFNEGTFTQRQAAPEAAFIKQVKGRGIPVILATTQEIHNLYECFGLTRGIDYDAHVLKPYLFEELCEPLDDLLQQTR